VFPVLLLAASRRKGEYMPGIAVRLLGHPAVLAGLYLLFVAGILLHGLVIWQDPFQRAAALLTGAITLVATGLIIRRGAFRPRAVVELWVDKRAGGLAHFSLVCRGRPMRAGVHLRYRTSEECLEAAEGTVANFQTLQSASFALLPGAPREVKVWAHEITPEGDSLPLPALLTVRDHTGAATPPFDLAQSGGQVVLPCATGASVLDLSFPQPG
jgi:hypothetical protein